MSFKYSRLLQELQEELPDDAVIRFACQRPDCDYKSYSDVLCHTHLVAMMPYHYYVRGSFYTCAIHPITAAGPRRERCCDVAVQHKGL